MFRVGDRVKFLRSGSQDFYGKVGTVTSVKGNGNPNVRFDVSIGGRRTWTNPKEDWALVKGPLKPIEKLMKHKFGNSYFV
jgi:hypothetical protein